MMTMACLRLLLRKGWLASALLLATPHSQALEITITAQYLGSASAYFENTTPPATFCSWALPCPRETVDVPITYVKEVIEADLRDQYYIKAPGQRQVDVVGDQTGDAHTLQFELTAIAQKTSGPLYTVSPVYNADVRGGCVREGGFARPPVEVILVWSLKNPQSPAPCHSRFSRAQPDYREVVTVSEMGVGYNMIMPAPYRMKPGIYRGSETYSIGPGGDFDFGNGISQLSGNSLTVNFVLDVQHAFFIDFPPGSDRAVLEPPAGWQNYLAGGRPPQKIYRDLPFRLSSTGPFGVYKLCQYDVDVRCGINNDDGDQVAVQLSLSLPGGIEHAGRPVSRLPVPTGRLQALQLDALTTTLNRPGQLHFEVGKSDVNRMLAHPGSTYTGQVTVVFDAEL
jgi:hypothetical protein